MTFIFTAVDGGLVEVVCRPAEGSGEQLRRPDYPGV